MYLGRGTYFQGRSYAAGTAPDPPTVLGDVRFAASPDHATVTSYVVRVRALGSTTIIAFENVGKPTPSAQNTITVNMTALFNARSPGNYTVSVAAINAEGETDSDVSTSFSLPLT